MPTIDDYKAALLDLVPGSHPVAADQLVDMQERAIARAMNHHSKHQPRLVVEEESGTGAFDYAVTLLASWAAGFSKITQVEHPVNDDDETANVLENTDWQIYEKPSGKVLRFLNDTPTTAETFRVTYTARHACDESACTVDDADEEAVEALAASYYAKMLAAAYALDSDSTIAADTVDHKSRHQAFLTISKQYRAEYNDHMGVDDKRPKPGCAIQDQDVDFPGGVDRLTHPRRYR